MGFDLMKNFDRPYLSKSVSEFWRRWHISLSTWFRDYVFIPLGGSRVAKYRVYINLMIVFVLSGIWHGANWTFVIWGALNGIFLIAESILKPAITYDTWWKKGVNIVITFIHICFTWIFFRARSGTEGFKIVRKIIAFDGPVFMGYPKDHFFYSLLFVALLLAYEFKQEFYRERIRLFTHPRPAFRYTFYTLAVAIVLLFGVFDGGQFIYFQF
jgi:D-alanyl-lipoteichoic acid acyltransferase DltB (MBOAT superfamily)